MPAWRRLTRTTGRWLLSHPQVAAVSFTGSIAAGRQVAAACGARGKLVQAELGGNNAVVVGRSADIEATARQVAAAAFSFAGQRCTAPRRLIVAQEVYAEFITAMISQVAHLRVGRPQEADTRLGPLISRERQRHTDALVEECRREGGQVICGGRIPPGFDGGCWYEPTLISGLRPQSRAVRDEAFGPLAVVLEAQDFDDALRSCNGVDQGLVAILYSSDPDEQRRFLDQAEAGILRIDDPQAGIHPDAPFTGWKASGIGLPEHGRWDGAFYTQPQAVYWPGWPA